MKKITTTEDNNNNNEREKIAINQNGMEQIRKHEMNFDLAIQITFA